MAVSLATGRTLLSSGVVPQITSPEFCVVRSRGSCRSSNRRYSTLLLTSRPPRRSASLFRSQPCSVPTRCSNSIQPMSAPGQTATCWLLSRCIGDVIYPPGVSYSYEMNQARNRLSAVVGCEDDKHLRPIGRCLQHLGFQFVAPRTVPVFPR